MTFFLEIDLTEIVVQKSGYLQFENFMWPSARLLICAMWPPKAHEFDTRALRCTSLYKVPERERRKEVAAAGQDCGSRFRSLLIRYIFLWKTIFFSI